MNEQILLWLDDTRNPEHYAPKWEGKIVWVKSYDEFDAYMEWNPMPAMISFDYMLGTGEDMFTDGIGCAKSVLRKCLHDGVSWPRWSIHSTFERVSKLRKYIEHAIHMYDVGDAVEENRQPNTPEQDAYEGVKERGISINDREPIQYVQRPGFSNQFMKKPESKPIVKSKTQGRNEPCNCGSGKKFKHCHGK